jgi:predicted DNA-binding transcriptional regulator YafY
VALFEDKQDPVTLALHRFSSAQMLEDRCRRPENFDLDQYLKDQPIFFPVADNAKEIELQFKMDKDAALDLEETPLTEHQEFDDSDEETVTISATVQDTQQLRWWLLSYGAQVEIIKPAAMRKYFANVTRKMSQLYSER